MSQSVDSYRRYEAAYCLHLRAQAVLTVLRDQSVHTRLPISQSVVF
jgi:hypothetical protein